MKYSIIVAFNNHYTLMSNFLEHLLQNTTPGDWELILYSDGCNDKETLDYLSKRTTEFPWIKLFYAPEQKGYSIANNLAVKESKGDILVFMNSDVLPWKGSIERLVHTVSKMASPCAAQGRLIFPQNMKIQSTGHLFCGCHNSHIYSGKRYDDPLVMQAGRRQALTTALCVVPRNVFEHYGGFDERYYNAYEGMELTLKITRDGGECRYCPDCPAYHITGGTRNAVQFDDDMPGRYFWSSWRGKLRSDLADYIQPQITDHIRNQIYFHINGGRILEWPSVLSSLGLSFEGQLMLRDRFLRNIDLYHNLPFSALQYAGPYLFTVDTIATIQGNYNWAAVRSNPYDLVLDGHGNAVTLMKLTGATG